MVKHLACGAEGPRFKSGLRHYDFRDWSSPASVLQYDWNIIESDLKTYMYVNQPTRIFQVL